MTLIEILVVITIIVVATGGVILSFRAVQKAQVRGSASKLAAAVRYLYDRAVVTGKYYRLTLDLDKATYFAEVSDDRFYLNVDKEKSPGRGKAYDADAETKLLDEEEKKRKENTRGLAAQLQPPPEPKRAHFQSFTDAMLPKVELRGSFVRDVYTPRQREPYTSGRAFIYFFPDGHSERAVIHVQPGKPPPPDTDPPRVGWNEVYTLILHPLTGRVELKNGDLDPPRDFDTVDEEGQNEGAR
jgi:general secretion pathway protein H